MIDVEALLKRILIPHYKTGSRVDPARLLSILPTVENRPEVRKAETDIEEAREAVGKAVAALAKAEAGGRRFGSRLVDDIKAGRPLTALKALKTDHRATEDEVSILTTAVEVARSQAFEAEARWAAVVEKAGAAVAVELRKEFLPAVEKAARQAHERLLNLNDLTRRVRSALTAAGRPRNLRCAVRRKVQRVREVLDPGDPKVSRFETDEVEELTRVTLAEAEALVAGGQAVYEEAWRVPHA